MKTKYMTNLKFTEKKLNQSKKKTYLCHEKNWQRQSNLQDEEKGNSGLGNIQDTEIEIYSTSTCFQLWYIQRKSVHTSTLAKTTTKQKNTQLWMERFMLGINLRDRIRNNELRERTGNTEVSRTYCLTKVCEMDLQSSGMETKH